MAHEQQLLFVKAVSEHLSNDFAGKKILEVGSIDVNGSIRSYFQGSLYLGVDLSEGPGVDLVCEGNKLDHPDETYHLTVSCECFEHNPHWVETFLNMYRMTKNGGIVMFTCATKGRLEHGTTRTSPQSSPGTQRIGWDYYLNLTENDVLRKIDIDGLFESHFFLSNKQSCDLYFVGRKRGAPSIFNFESVALRDHCIEVQRKLQEELKRKVNAKPRYPAPLRLLSRISNLPMAAAMMLPDPQYQDFVIAYSRLLAKAKTPAKLFVDRFLKR